MNITLKQTKLPSSYSKIGQLDIQIAFQKWVTVAHFHSHTTGQNDSFWMYRHGDDQIAKEITGEQYHGLIRNFYSPTPMETVKGKVIMWTAVTTTERIVIAQSLAAAPEPVREAAKHFKWEGNELIGEDVPKTHWHTMYIYFLGWGDARNEYQPKSSLR